MTAILCSLLHGAVHSQSEPSDSTHMLDELVISANKIPELRNKLSRQVHIISTAQINNLNSQTTAELLGNSGTVTIQKSQQGGGSPQIRGFEASRILLIIDGVRMNNPTYRAGHLQNIITLDNIPLSALRYFSGPLLPSMGPTLWEA